MRLLGIETSCDETAAAVVADGARILSNVVASQVDIHARYGGIVPEVASRQHLLMIAPVVEEAMQAAGVAWADLAAIAVTVGPGLAGSLLVGVNAAKAISWAQGLPLVGVNHLEAHIYANWLREPGVGCQGPGARGHGSWVRNQEPGTKNQKPGTRNDEQGTGPPNFPFVCLIVSGGHTDLLLATGHGEYRLLGRTRDDAAGEAFDKVARLLGLGYPGGPVIQRVAEGAAPAGYRLPRAWLRGSHDFSFSGLKTAVLRLVEEGKVPRHVGEGGAVPEGAASAAAAFQESVADVLVTKTIAAARKHGVRQILLAGGVAANKALRESMLRRSPVPVLIPPPALCTDNAAMVASCGYFRFQRGERAPLDIDVAPSLGL